MANHTPAPWVVEVPKESNGYVNIQMGNKFASVYGDVVDTLGHPSEETIATARLISKAPEMLEMLKELADNPSFSGHMPTTRINVLELIKTIEG